MSNSFMFNIELGSIQSFLERVGKSVDADYIELVRCAEAGEFEDEDEEDNAFFEPMMSDEIAVRAVLGELNALIEWELQHLASVPLTKEQQAKRPKRPKTVWDLNRDELSRLIQDYYHVSLSDLPGAEAIEEIRRTANAYKHRKGFKDWRKDPDMKYFPEKFQLHREETFRKIKAVRNFIMALSAVTKTGRVPNGEA